MNRAEILDEAKRIVTQDRSQTHGDPEDSFKAIADLWSAYTGIKITPMEACHMMVMLKIVRAKGNPTYADNHVDGAGYFACGGEIATRSTEAQQSASDASEPVPSVKTADLPHSLWEPFIEDGWIKLKKNDHPTLACLKLAISSIEGTTPGSCITTLKDGSRYTLATSAENFRNLIQQLP